MIPNPSPTRFGPMRSCTHEATLRSRRIRYATVPRMAPCAMIVMSTHGWASRKLAIGVMTESMSRGSILPGEGMGKNAGCKAGRRLCRNLWHGRPARDLLLWVTVAPQPPEGGACHPDARRGSIGPPEVTVRLGPGFYNCMSNGETWPRAVRHLR